jgi:hypothetical protein
MYFETLEPRSLPGLISAGSSEKTRVRYFRTDRIRRSFGTTVVVSCTTVCLPTPALLVGIHRRATRSLLKS